MKEMKHSLLIIGVQPPPIGGVSIHLRRLLQKLELEKIKYTFFDYQKRNILFSLVSIFRSRLIHLNFSNRYLRFCIALFAKILRKKVVITFHGKYNFGNLLDRASLKLADSVFVLNSQTLLAAQNSLKKGDERVNLISAFIPPFHEEPLPTEISNWLKVNRSKYEEVFCTNAHSFTLDKEGKDLYGIDFLIKIFNEEPQKLLIISDPSGELAKYYQEKAKVNIKFISIAHSFVEVIKLSDTFVRSTSTDGDSLSVKEALFYKKKVVASNVVDRPVGCILYLLGDQKSFLQALNTNLVLTESTIVDGSIAIIEMYRKLLPSL